MIYSRQGQIHPRRQSGSAGVHSLAHRQGVVLSFTWIRRRRGWHVRPQYTAWRVGSQLPPDGRGCAPADVAASRKTGSPFKVPFVTGARILAPPLDGCCPFCTVFRDGPVRPTGCTQKHREYLPARSGINGLGRGSSLPETKQGGPARHESRLMRRKVHAMKKLVALALLLSLGVFAVGCEKPKDKGPEGGAPATEEGKAPATEEVK